MKPTRPSLQESVAPNLIPMIDIMFLLLLFFMLGSDLSQRELESVRLPKAEQARQDPPADKDGRLTINAHHDEAIRCDAYDHHRICRDEAHWRIRMHGEDCTEAGKLSAAIARSALPTGLALSERKVMIRADGGAPFGLARRALGACAENKIYKIEVGAARPKPD
jgi:biopolymer transport protein ExbD